jgi:hypothetical protein
MSDFKDWVFLKQADSDLTIHGGYAELQVGPQMFSTNQTLGKNMHVEWRRMKLGEHKDLRSLVGMIGSDLGILFDLRDWYIDKTQTGVIACTYYVNEHNNEATKQELADWKSGAIPLAIAYLRVHIQFSNKWTPDTSEIRSRLGMR